MTNDNYTEGYNDGFNGAGLQDRHTGGALGWYHDMRYREGFILGSLDRRGARERDAAAIDAQRAEYEVVEGGGHYVRKGGVATKQKRARATGAA